MTGHLDIAKLLLDKGADVHRLNAKGNTPLLCATLSKEMILLLIERGSDIYKKNANGANLL